MGKVVHYASFDLSYYDKYLCDKYLCGEKAKYKNIGTGCKELVTCKRCVAVLKKDGKI